MTTAQSPSQGTSFKPPRTGWQVFLLICGLESLSALIWLGLIPGDPKNGLLLGFSASRLVLMLVALSAAVLFLISIWIINRSNRWFSRIAVISGLTSQNFLFFCFGLLALGITGWGFLVFLRADPGEATFAVFERLLPILSLVCVISLEFLFWLIYLRNRLNWNNIREYRSLGIMSLAVFLFLIIIAAVLAITRFGITPDEFFWGSPGVPLLSWQVISSGLIALAAFIAARLIKKPMDWKGDLVLFLVFWLGSYILWMSQPVPRSYFTPSPRAPNFEVYPYSDAGFYDYVSQSLLIGSGFLNGQIITRPLYAVLLAGFHTVVGQNYNGMIALQTVLLALFPAILYLLGKIIHCREVGIVMGSLAVWREMNLLAATPFTEVSNSKMLLTDSLTGVVLAGLVLWLVWWQKKKANSWVIPLVMGGYFGLMLLLRAQALVILPVIIALVLIIQRKHFKKAFAVSVIFTIGTIISLSPWLWRNYQLTHQIILDQPSQAALTAIRFTLSTETMDTSLTTKPPQEVSAVVLRFVLNNPLFTLKFMAAHFLNNELSTLTVIPLKFNLIDPRDNLFIHTPFWLDGVKGLSIPQIILLVINLAIISAGIAYSYWKLKWIGLIPLLIHLAYSASSAVARISGWRFVQPVDWVGYLYFSIGLVSLIYGLIRLFGFKKDEPESITPISDVKTGKKFPWMQLAGWAVCFFLLGAITPGVEWFIPQRYPLVDPRLIFDKFKQDPLVSQGEGVKDHLKELSSQKNSTALWGRALYPRFYKIGQGEPGSGWMAYKAKDYARLGFMMVTPSGDYQVILPVETSPQSFPNGSDVMLVGCKKEGFIEAAAVLVKSASNTLYLSSQNNAFQCP